MKKYKYSVSFSRSLFEVYKRIYGLADIQHKDLVAETGHSSGVVSEITNQLLDMGLITVKKLKKKEQGNPKRYYTTSLLLQKFLKKFFLEEVSIFIIEKRMLKDTAGFRLSDDSPSFGESEEERKRETKSANKWLRKTEAENKERFEKAKAFLDAKLFQYLADEIMWGCWCDSFSDFAGYFIYILDNAKLPGKKQVKFNKQDYEFLAAFKFLIRHLARIEAYVFSVEDSIKEYFSELKQPRDLQVVKEISISFPPKEFIKAYEKKRKEAIKKLKGRSSKH